MARRPKKPDGTALRRLMGTAVTGEASYRKVQNHLTTYDQVVSEYERKWGCERLPLLVDEQLRDRFWSQMDKLNHAIEKGTPVDVEHQVQVTLRAYKALEAKAIEMGAKPLEGIAWTAVNGEGQVVAICKDIYEVSNIKKDMPDAMVYSVQEVAAIIAAWSDKASLVNAVKDAFPGATVTKVTPTEKLIDDEIPF